jgi:hypothetical protein
VEGAIRAMAAHYPPALVAQVREISQIANILAVVSWIVVVLSPWGEQEMTKEDLKKIEAAFARIEASLGVGRSCLVHRNIAQSLFLSAIAVHTMVRISCQSHVPEKQDLTRHRPSARVESVIG